VSATAAGECIRRAQCAGLSWPLPDDLTDEVLDERRYPPPALAARDRRPQPNWATVHGKQRRPGVTLHLLGRSHPDGYGYSRFCELYRACEPRLSPTIAHDNIRV
jgi:transposase